MGCLRLGGLCAVGYFIYAGVWYYNVLITFSCSVLLLFAVEYCRQRWEEGHHGAVVFFVCGVALTAAFCTQIPVDYGFFGVLLPVFPALVRRDTESTFTGEGRIRILLAFSGGVLLLCACRSGIQWFGLLTIPCIFLYSGGRGRLPLKHFFTGSTRCI